MSARRPLQPLSPLSANIVGAKYSYVAKASAGLDGYTAMDERVHEDNTQDIGSIVSGLTSLENDADDFDRLMIQQVRDKRRMNDALRGNTQPFRKARTHPNVGLTLENLERNNARINARSGPGAQVKFESPSSASSKSSGTDPAIRVPLEWGRKGRVRRDWLRTITTDEEQSPGAQEAMATEDVTPGRSDRGIGIGDADRPLPSVEDSPLSHKKSFQGTLSSNQPGYTDLGRVQDWDFTVDLNEASLIASTPYLPQNTTLHDIRQREIESLKEQAVTTNRLHKIKETSPKESRGPRSSSRASGNHQANSTIASEQVMQGANSPATRKRTNSWKTIGRSQAVVGENGEQIANSPIVVYKKSAETIGVVDRELLANAQTSPKRPFHRREDSHDLLRRLARVSSGTPSPNQAASARPRTAPALQPESSSQGSIAEALSSMNQDSPPLEKPRQTSTSETGVAAPETQPSQKQPDVIPPEPHSTLVSPQEPQPANADDTPIPTEVSILTAKTPRVTGAWVDTPALDRRSTGASMSPSEPLQSANLSKTTSDKQREGEMEGPSGTPREPSRTTFPRSALQAVVEEAKANGRSRNTQDTYGDSTIDSLEELIAPGVGDPETADQDEDTLLGLQLPTSIPRTEAERQRQQELLHLHRMNERLRAARTSIRDASRGMKRVENQVEHFEEIDGERVRVIYRDCPCVHNGGHQGDPWSVAWKGFKSLFYDSSNISRTGLTWLSISIISFWVWFILEVAA
ncbi:hypothetical protein CC78DRAFT_267187 [Lojkania enalia]|uniref:Uncharacterized protein n=1 Tax=Lojkania enalia TaxID=147567 RepID=A0A9P4K9Y2_9PLEO|nr:hypothetical protein CC78DRAFT_267187 [Didymosphaeria enalia]